MSAVDIIDGRGYILNVEFGGGKDGVDGKDGRDGVAPDLQIGTVKESEDDQPHVTISDEGDGKLSLNFDLVSGQDGQNGEDGGVFIPSVSQDGVISWIAPEGQNPPQAVSVKGEAGATFTPEVSLGGEISWTNDRDLENPDTRNIRGPKGEKGDPFTIRETYASINEMNADFNNPYIPEGSFVCIASNESDPDNAKMYVKGDSAYVFVTDLSGATGMRGPAGIGIGKVEFTGVETATYKEYGVYDDTDDENLLGTFNLPKGADGHQGSDGVGIRSIVQTTTSHEDDGTNVITVTLTNDNTSTFTVENGSRGSTGAQGPAGQDGQDGQDGVGIDHISVEQTTLDGQPNRVTIHLTNETSETFDVYNGRTGATANNSLITIQKNGTEINHFTLNQSSPGTVNILVPTTVAELSDASNYALVSSLAAVATSGSYYDLDDIPTIGNAELKIRSVNNTSPETYYNIGTFSANAISDTTIDLAKVARTGNYSDLIGTPIVGKGNVTLKYSSGDSFATIGLNNNFNSEVSITSIYPLFKKGQDKYSQFYDSFDCYTVLMGVKRLFKYVANPGSSANVVTPCPFLMFDQTNSPSKNNCAILLQSNKSYIIECCISAVKLHAEWNGDSVESVTTDNTASGSINMVFYIYVKTGANSGIYSADDVKIFSVNGNMNGTSSVIDNARFIGSKTSPYGSNQNLEIITCPETIVAGTVDAYYKQLYKNINGKYTPGATVLLTLFYELGRSHSDGYNLGICIPMNDSNTNGIDATASLRVLKCAPIDYQYSTSGWDIDAVDYIN